MKKIARILIAGPLPPPVGGVETVTKAVLESSAFAMFDLAHCSLNKGRPKETQGRFDLGNIWWAIVLFFRMGRSIYTHKPHVVYMPLSTTWSGFCRDVVLAWIATRGGCKIIGHIHGPKIFNILEKRGISGMIIRSCLEQYKVLLVLGRAWKDLIYKYNYKGRVEVISSTLNKEFFDKANKFKRNYQNDNVDGLFVGQVGQRKGVFDLLEALHQLKVLGKPAKVIIVGPPEQQGEWDALMERREALGVEDVAEFTGSLQGHALREVFQDASYFILPSYREGLPVVFFEAASYGLPVIATPVGVSTDLLEHNNNCLLVTPGDVPEITSAIDKMRSSVNLRQKYGLQLKKDIERYHPDNVCKNLSDIIVSVL